jgi:hypothetical protein
MKQRLAQADQADEERIVAEANEALTKAIADQGLSVEEYSSILEMAQNDPDLRGKTPSAHTSTVTRSELIDQLIDCASTPLVGIYVLWQE